MPVSISTNEYFFVQAGPKKALGERERERIWYFMPFSSHVVDE